MEKIPVNIHDNKILRQTGEHIKTCRVEYILELIAEHGLFFLCDKRKEITPEERCLIAEYHYKQIAIADLERADLERAGQYLMSSKLSNAHVTHRMTRIHNEEQVHFIVFSSNLQVNVTPLHYRLFASKPLFKTSVPVKQGELQL